MSLDSPEEKSESSKSSFTLVPRSHSWRQSIRDHAKESRKMLRKTLVCVLEFPKSLVNIGAIVRNVNGLGTSKLYIIGNFMPKDLQSETIGHASAGADKWTYMRVFPSTVACFDYLEEKKFVSVVTSPHCKEACNVKLEDHDWKQYKKLAIWFGNESTGVSGEALSRVRTCVQLPMGGMVESLNLASCNAIVLHWIARERKRQFLGTNGTAFNASVLETIRV